VVSGSEKLNFFVRTKAGDLDSCIEVASFGEDDVDEIQYACGVVGLFITDTASEISAENLEVDDLDCCELFRDFDADRYAGVRGVDDEPCRADPLVGGDDDLLDDPLGALNLLLVACCCFRDDEEVVRVSIDLLLRSLPSKAWPAPD
jgi:hypothetical protein